MPVALLTCPAQEVIMKRLSAHFAMAAVAVLLIPAPGSAQPGRLTIRQVGTPAPTGLGNFGRVGEPIRPGGVWLGRHRERGSRYGRGAGYGSGYGYDYGYGALGGWGGGLYEDPEAFRDAGFFAGSGDAHVVGGRVHYDYDRGYPYDWYRPRDASPARSSADNGESPARISCEVEAAGVRVCRGRR
jgi:hypothetical protein